MIVVLLLFWILFCVLVGSFAAHKGRSFAGFFILTVLSSPLIGFIVALCVRSRDQLVAGGEQVEGAKKCPFCAEVVRAEAIKCKHCGSELPPSPESPKTREPMTQAEYKRMFNIGDVQ